MLAVGIMYICCTLCVLCVRARALCHIGFSVHMQWLLYTYNVFSICSVCLCVFGHVHLGVGVSVGQVCVALCFAVVFGLHALR